MTPRADIDRAHKVLCDLKIAICRSRRMARILLWIVFVMLLSAVVQAWCGAKLVHQIVDIAVATGEYAARLYFLRRARLFECARRNLELLIRRQWNSTAVEHHFDQAMAALERL